jgi:hypothetical protein
MEARESDAELSSDDEDFEPEQEPSDDEEVSDCKESDEEEQQISKTKRKRGGKTIPEEKKTEKNTPLDPEAEKKRLEALWSDFLGDTSTTIENSAENQSKSISASVLSTNKVESDSNKPTKLSTSDDLFGSINSTHESDIKELNDKPRLIPTSSNSNQMNILKRPKPTVNSMLNQLSKKSKSSILESTKSDWEGYKSVEGISEELQTYNRGRNG